MNFFVLSDLLTISCVCINLGARVSDKRKIIIINHPRIYFYFRAVCVRGCVYSGYCQQTHSMLGITEVIENLYLSGLESRHAILSKGIRSVINISSECPVQDLGPSVEYEKVSILDVPTTSIHPYFDRLADRIHQNLQQGTKTLVHCYVGRSRSATIILGKCLPLRQRRLVTSFDVAAKLVNNMRTVASHDFYFSVSHETQTNAVARGIPLFTFSSAYRWSKFRIYQAGSRPQPFATTFFIVSSLVDRLRKSDLRVQHRVLCEHIVRCRPRYLPVNIHTGSASTAGRNENHPHPDNNGHAQHSGQTAVVISANLELLADTLHICLLIVTIADPPTTARFLR